MNTLCRLWKTHITITLNKIIKRRPRQERCETATLEDAVITIKQDPNRFVADLADGVKLDCSFLEICTLLSDPRHPPLLTHPSIIISYHSAWNQFCLLLDDCLIGQRSDKRFHKWMPALTCGSMAGIPDESCWSWMKNVSSDHLLLKNAYCYQERTLFTNDLTNPLNCLNLPYLKQ